MSSDVFSSFWKESVNADILFFNTSGSNLIILSNNIAIANSPPDST